MLVAQKVTTGVYKGVTTSELDELAAETAASMTASHPDYALVGWQGDGGSAMLRGGGLDGIDLVCCCMPSKGLHLRACGTNGCSCCCYQPSAPNGALLCS